MKIKFKFSPESIPAILRYAGIKPTAQRIAVCEFLFLEADHPTVEEIKAAVDIRFPKISLATVYNTVHTLVEAGLLKSIKFPHSGRVVYDRNTDHHYHFIDEKTEQLIDLSPEAIELRAKLSDEFEISSVDIFIRGNRK